MINVTRTDLLYGVLSLSIIFGGKMDNKFKRIIELKKLKGSSRKPKYATRKLSVGLVSCMLGYALLVSPSSVEAAGLDANTQAVEETEDTTGTIEETTEETTTTDETTKTTTDENEAPAEEATPAASDEAIAPTGDEAPKEAETTEEAPEVKDETLVEDKEAFTLSEAQKQNLKEAGFTDSEIAEIEKEIANKLEADSSLNAQTLVDEKISEKTDTLGMAEEDQPEAVAAGEKKITNIQGSIDGNTKSGINTVKPLAKAPGEGYDTILKTAFSFNVPDTITGGDTFEVNVSDNVNIHGISQVPEIDDIYYNGQLLAKAEVQQDGRTIIYRFTDYVDKIANIKMNISFPLFIDKVNVPEDGPQEVVVTVDGQQFSKNINVDYSKEDYYKGPSKTNPKVNVETLSGIANIDNYNDKKYTHTIYVNTNNQELTNSQLRIRNQDKTDGAIFDKDVVDSVKVYRVNDGKQLKGSFNLNYDDLTNVTDKATVRKALDEKMGILVDINQKNDKASYVVVYDGKRKENTSLNTIVEFGATTKKRTDGTSDGTVPLADKNWSYKNDVHFDNGDGGATGEDKIYKLGDKVWIDENGNGIQDPGEKPLKDVYVSIVVNGQETILRTDENGNYVFYNLPNGEYEVKFANLQGYKPTKAKQGADDAVDSDATLVDSVVKTKATIADKDNMNVDLGLIKESSGTFTEHHVYKEYKDGQLVNTTKIDIPVVKGSEDETFETSAKPNGTSDNTKEGFTLVKDEITKSDEITGNITGDKVTRNFIDGKDLQVTYVYRKDTASEKGSFQEHHIYQTVDEEGNVVSTDFENHKDVKTGNVGEEYKTSKIDQPTYTLKEVKPANGAASNTDGSEATGTFVKDTKQEVTYIYTRVQQNGSFQEHHKYITKDQDGKITETKTEDGKTTKGNEKQSYTTGKVEKDGFEFKRIENPIGGQFIHLMAIKQQVTTDLTLNKKLLMFTKKL